MEESRDFLQKREIRHVVQFLDEDVRYKQTEEDDCKDNSGNKYYFFAAAFFGLIKRSASAECSAQACAFLLQEYGRY